MADTQALTSGVFNFFGLPRELRDAVYHQHELVAFHQTKLENGDDDRKHHVRLVMRKPLTNLLLVNRQLASEYLERRKRFSKATVVDHQSFTRCGLVVPEQARRVHHLQLRLVIACIQYGETPQHICYVDEDTEFHTNWIPAFAGQMNSLETIHIKLYISDIIAVKTCFEKILARLSCFTSIEKVDTVEIRLQEYRDNEVNPGFPSVRLTVWKAGQGLVEMHTNRLGCFSGRKAAGDSQAQDREETANVTEDESEYELEDTT